MARQASARRFGRKQRPIGTIEGLCFVLAVAFTAAIALGLLP